MPAQLCTIVRFSAALLSIIILLILWPSNSFLRSLVKKQESVDAFPEISKETQAPQETAPAHASQGEPSVTGAITPTQPRGAKHAQQMDCTGRYKNFMRYLTNSKIQKKEIQAGLAKKDYGWRVNLLNVIQQHPLPPGDVYEFGVYNGGSFVGLQHFLSRKVWGFDSFSGLPEESTKVDFQNSGFQKGKYTAKKGIPECLTSFFGGTEKVDFVKGFFKYSLTDSLARGRSMRPAAYVDIDVDLYTATYEALDWLFKSDLMQIGTIVGYDDWWSNSCSRGAPHVDNRIISPLKTSEGRAHSEITLKYKVKFVCIGGSCEFRSSEAGTAINWGPIFKIVNIGGSVPPDHGFVMSADQESQWRRANPVCKEEFMIHRITGR